MELNVGMPHSSSGQECQTTLNENDYDDFWGEEVMDDIPNDNDMSGLNREWERRHNQFHTIGYRDGISAGKEASVQEGFNEGFGQSIDSGYSWGLVRGVSSVLAALPDQLTEKLVCDPERKERFGKLYESTRSISANDALHSFRNDLLKHETKNTGELAQSFCYGQLDSFSKDLSLLLRDCPEIKMNGFHAKKNNF